MRLFNNISSLASALILSGSLYAAPQALCPDINDIKAEGLFSAENIVSGFFFSYNIDYYNTEDQWGFAIAPIAADSSKNAIIAANDILKSMSAPGVPETIDPFDVVVCTYTTGHPNLMAVAVKSDGLITPSLLRHYVKTMV
jgi:hypothetical protein